MEKRIQAENDHKIAAIKRSLMSLRADFGADLDSLMKSL
jgi:hypothetical protein